MYGWRDVTWGGDIVRLGPKGRNRYRPGVFKCPKGGLGSPLVRITVSRGILSRDSHPKAFNRRFNKAQHCRRDEMGIEVTKDGKMINTCDWPGCGCREVVKWLYDKGWMSFMGADEEMREIIGLPDWGMLCLHHQDALEAYEDGEEERFLLLASI